MMDNRGTVSPGTEMVVHHQTLAMSRVPAPSRSPSLMASPVVVGTPPLHSVEVGAGRYCARMAWFFAKPAAARLTALRVWMRRALPAYDLPPATPRAPP